MRKLSRIHPAWVALLLLASLGAKGCPAQVGCGVSGSMPGGARQFGAETWNCQVGMQFAQGNTVTTPQQAKTDLLAKKESAAVQVASLREKAAGGDQAFGFGGTGQSGTAAAEANSQLEAATRDFNTLSAQVTSIEQLQPPPGTTVLSDGTWTVQGDKAVFQTNAPYDPEKKYVIPFVVRSERGEVVEMGYIPVTSVQVEPAR